MRPLIVLSLILSLAACDRQSPQPPQAGALDKEAVGVVDVTHAGQSAPAVPFSGPTDAPATLATFRGKPLLVNLWATWCAPCVREMPTLDELAKREVGRFHTIVVSQNMEGRKVVTDFFAKEKFHTLQPYLDEKGVLPMALGAENLPTTIFYDAKGKELWRVTGAMDWTSDKAKKLIDGALG